MESKKVEFMEELGEGMTGEIGGIYQRVQSFS
jgi:hypothetical protein